MTSFSAEERELEERDYEDEVQAACRARSFDELHDLQVSASALAEAIRRRAVAERADRREANERAQVVTDETNRRRDRRPEGYQ